MARSPDNHPLAFPAEVARYLCVEPRDVKQMIKLDKLPAITLPRNRRNVSRVPLRDFHQWLIGRRSQKKEAVLASYETFLADFNKTARAA